MKFSAGQCKLSRGSASRKLPGVHERVSVQGKLVRLERNRSCRPIYLFITSPSLSKNRKEKKKEEERIAHQPSLIPAAETGSSIIGRVNFRPLAGARGETDRETPSSQWRAVRRSSRLLQFSPSLILRGATWLELSRVTRASEQAGK